MSKVAFERRVLLLLTLVAGLLWLTLLLSWRGGERPMPRPEIQVTRRNPYEGVPILEPYRRVHDASSQGDLASLETFLARSEGRGSYLAYRTLLALARDDRLPSAQRARYYERVFNAGLLEPLAREDVRRAHLEYARVAEGAGLLQKARDAYVEALPLAAAAGGLKRLEPRPRALARLFLEAREYELALDALGRERAPAIEAPAYGALGEPARALEAYNRWLEEVPTSTAAREGKAWTLLALERFGEARTLFAGLPGGGVYGRAVIAEGRGDFEEAAHLYAESGPEGLWRATEMLEVAGREAEALPLYLALARSASKGGSGSGSDAADDAAYRALVLAERLGDEAAAAQARALLPAFSYFSLARGVPLVTPQTSALPHVTQPVLALSKALLRAGDREAALGELILALQRADDEATTVALAEALGQLGEFRHSQSAAAGWVAAGSRDARTWRAAYPQAYRAPVRSYAAAWGVDPALVWAVMRQESAFYPRAVSVSEARGLMQIVPATWEWLAELLAEPPADPFRVADNIRYGTFYLHRLLEAFDGDLERAVPAYNGGPGYIGRLFESERVGGDKNDFYRFIDRPETREYLQKVMLNYAVYRSLYPERMSRR